MHLGFAEKINIMKKNKTLEELQAEIKKLKSLNKKLKKENSQMQSVFATMPFNWQDMVRDN